MALPPQAVEKLIHDPAETQGVYRQFLLLASALLILMAVLFAGLEFGYATYLRSSIQDLNQQILEFSKKIPPEQQAGTTKLYSQLINLRELLKNHSTASPVLALLERTASPDIYYTKMNLNAAANEVDLTGVARSIEAIATQAAMLQKQPEVERVNFTNAGQSQNVWQFTMSVFLKPNVLRTTPGASAVAGTPVGNPNATSSAP